MSGLKEDLLVIQADAPDWYHEAMADAAAVRFVNVKGCSIHYLYWPSKRVARGNLLLVHGGGGHAHWWSFLAPFLSRDLNVAALCLSGMGESGPREEYDSDTRVADMRGVINDLKFQAPTYVLGHSFGGFMVTRFGQIYGHEISGLIIADSPLRPPNKRQEDQDRRPRMGSKRYYKDFDEALGRFRLMPAQPCNNAFLVEHIGRHSLKWEDDGWCWKWDGAAMENRRFGEPFHEYLLESKCKKSFIYGEKSKLVDSETLEFIEGLLGPNAPVIGIPEAHHHLMLDQPMAFVTAVRGVLAAWGSK
jgi:pimeloyl-ACP methyl ester carboxylesterase